MPESSERAARAAADLSDHRERVFVDDEGTRWQVSERPFTDYDRRRGVSLIFASDSAVRRVRDFPADWYSLSIEALIALSWKS